MVLDYTRMKNFVKQGKIPLSRHHFWLCFEVNRGRSTEVDLLRPHENNPNILLLGESFGLFVLFEYPNFNSKK